MISEGVERSGGRLWDRTIKKVEGKRTRIEEFSKKLFDFSTSKDKDKPKQLPNLPPLASSQRRRRLDGRMIGVNIKKGQDVLDEICSYQRRTKKKMIDHEDESLKRSKMLYEIEKYRPVLFLNSRSTRDVQGMLQDIRKHVMKGVLRKRGMKCFADLLSDIRRFKKESLVKRDQLLKDICEFDSGKLKKRMDKKREFPMLQWRKIFHQIDYGFYYVDVNLALEPKNIQLQNQKIRMFDKKSLRKVKKKRKDFQRLLQDIRSFDIDTLIPREEMFREIHLFDKRFLKKVKTREPKFLLREQLFHKIRWFDGFWLDSLEPPKNFQQMLQDVRTFDRKILRKAETRTHAKILRQIQTTKISDLKPRNKLMEKIRLFDKFKLANAGIPRLDNLIERLKVFDGIRKFDKSKLFSFTCKINERSFLPRALLLEDIRFKFVRGVPPHIMKLKPAFFKTKNMDELRRTIRSFNIKGLKRCVPACKNDLFSEIKSFRKNALKRRRTKCQQDLLKEIREFEISRLEHKGPDIFDEMKGFDKKKLKRITSKNFSELKRDITSKNWSLKPRMELLKEIRWFDRRFLNKRITIVKDGMKRSKMIYGITIFNSFFMKRVVPKDFQALLQEIRSVRNLCYY